MKLLKQLLLFLLLCGSAQAQKMSNDFNLSWGDISLVHSKESQLISLFQKEGEYYVIRKEVIRGPGGWHYLLEKYDQGLKLIEVKNISDDLDIENYGSPQFVKLGDNFFIISSKHDSPSNTLNYYSQLLDVEMMTVSKPRNFITFENVKRRRDINIRFTVSANDQYISTHYTTYDRKTKVRKFYCYIFDESLELMWQQEDLDISGKTIRKFFLANDGVLSLAVSKAGKGKWFSYEPGEPNKIEFLLISEDGIDPIFYEFKNYTPSGVSITKTADQNYILSGYYYEGSSLTLEGVYSVTIDPKTGDEINEVHKEFSNELLKDGESQKDQERFDKASAKGHEQGASKMDVIRVLKHENGSISLIGEKNWVEVTTTTDANGRTTTKYTYYRTDLIITTIKDGEIISNVKVNKFAKSRYKFTGFRAISVNNKPYIFFNDHRENIISIDPEKGIKRNPTKKKNKALVVVKVDGDSKSREGIIDYATKEYESFTPYKLGYNLRVMDNNEIIAWTYKGKNQYGLFRISHK
jgi:hypothetical protein